MEYTKEKEKLVEYGKKLLKSGLTRGTGGNLSYFDADDNQLMIITPSGIDYNATTVDDLVILDLNGDKVKGARKPSSEWRMHLELYKHRPEFNYLIHSHATYATTLSILNKPLVAVDYLVAKGGGKDVKVAKYASFGTLELAENALEAMKDRSAVILANHGINVASDTIEGAYSDLEILEFCCELYIRALSAGSPIVLSDEEMLKMKQDFKTYGQ